MNQYIITKELADKLDAAFWNPCNHNHCELMVEVYSHPYNPQAERETILLSCIKSGNLIESREALEHLFNRHETCKRERIRCPLCREELREGKDGEK